MFLNFQYQTNFLQHQRCGSFPEIEGVIMFAMAGRMTIDIDGCFRKKLGSAWWGHDIDGVFLMQTAISGVSYSDKDDGGCF